MNDFSRILADRVLRGCLVEHGSRSREEARRVPLVWSGGCDGVIAPHMTVFAEVGDDGNGSAADVPEDGRLAIGVALSDRSCPRRSAASR